MDRAVPIIPVEDVDRAKAHYLDGLGFSVASEGHYPNEQQEGTILVLDRGTVRVTLDCPMPGHGRNVCVSLEVGDADALYEEWSSRVAINEPPENQPWGRRTFGVSDPFGNSLFVMGPVTEE